MRQQLVTECYHRFIKICLGDIMGDRDWLTEDEVIEGVKNFLMQKGCTIQKRVIKTSSAAKKEHGVDLVMKLENSSQKGNLYFIEAKGNVKSDGNRMKSLCKTNFRWALSQIILRINVDSRNYNYNYGIAMPRSDVEQCIELIRENWALDHLKIRLYGVFYNKGQLTAKEYLPKDIYKHRTKRKQK